MKKIIFTGIAFFILSGIFAQDLKKAKSYLDAKQLDKAKTEIDAYVAKTPGDPSGLYLKSKIYGEIAANDQFKTLVADPRSEAFEAFKKSIDIDTKNILLLELTKDQYKPIFNIYTGYYDAGAAYFNTAITSNKKEDFDNALNTFKKANVVGQYIYKKKWALSELDTPLVLIMGKAALNAGKKDEALNYFKSLADANITQTRGDNVSYELPYQWLTYYYKDAKDEANFLKYSSLGKKYFPKDDYYDAVALDYYRDKKDYNTLFKKYDEVLVTYPDSVRYHFNYANEAFTYVYSDEGIKVNNRDALLKNIGSEIQKALTLNPNDVNTNWLAAQYYYNQGVDLKQNVMTIKGTKPEDVKMKADINMHAKDMLNKAIPYTDKALSSLESNGYKKSDKSRYKSLVDLEQRIYQALNQADKVKL
ncbi:MAG: hypothetical protein M3004_09865, partial [Bacteroidota bacterium]|nr:hypothetical protein [Bacteroidota bacterium]